MMRERTKNIITALLLVYGVTFIFLLWFVKVLDWNEAWNARAQLTAAIAPTVILGEVFRRWLWRFPPFSWLVKVPNLNGTWKGKLRSSYEDDDGRNLRPIPVTLFIEQTLTNIHLTFQTDSMSSRSKSMSATLAFIEDTKRAQLIYTYCNDGNATKGWNKHCGTVILDIEGNRPTELRGNYFTDREPQTKGELELTKEVS